MTKEEKIIYMKAYNKAYRIKNKERLNEYNKAWRSLNVANKKVYDKVYYSKNYSVKYLDNKNRRESEGLGVYKAIYPSGVYIGSGWIYTRRSEHLCGGSHIGRKLNEKALSFEVLSLTDTKEESLELEQLVVDTLGISGLLNTANILKGE